MAIDFNTFNKDQLEAVRTLAQQIDSNEELDSVVPYNGGYLPEQLYKAALQKRKLGDITLIPSTVTGAKLVRNVMIIVGATVGADPNVDKQRMDLVASIAIQGFSRPTAADSYQDWYKACRNVPSNESETVLGLLYVGEFIDAAMQAMEGGLGTILTALQEAKNATRH